MGDATLNADIDEQWEGAPVDKDIYKQCMSALVDAETNDKWVSSRENLSSGFPAK